MPNGVSDRRCTILFLYAYLLWKNFNFYIKISKMLKILKNNEKFIVKTIDFLKFIGYI
jgi:hypothetical protein